MTRIFISYRRDDSSGHTGRLRDTLVKRFGRDEVFMDVDAIDVGTDFTQRIGAAIGDCDVLVAVIGREWLSAADPHGGRRLDNNDDLVRAEIREALEHEVTVFPVLVRGAPPPTARELPPDIAGLAQRHAHELSDTRWDYDVGKLMDALDRGGGGIGGAAARLQARLGLTRPQLALVAVFATLTLALAALFLARGDSSSSPATCANLTIPPDVRAQLSDAAGTSAPATEGSVFYGSCEDDTWAIATFPSSPGDGVFHREGDSWDYRGGIDEAGCEVPEGLRREWGRAIC
jgi:TIR domain-containing protein